MKAVETRGRTWSNREFAAFVAAVLVLVAGAQLLRPGDPAGPEPAAQGQTAPPLTQAPPEPAPPEPVESTPEPELLPGELSYDEARGVFRLEDFANDDVVFSPREIQGVAPVPLHPDLRYVELSGNRRVEAPVATLRQMPRGDLYRLDYTLSGNAPAGAHRAR